MVRSEARYGGCQVQICSHPTCWNAAKRFQIETLMNKNESDERERKKERSFSGQIIPRTTGAAQKATKLSILDLSRRDEKESTPLPVCCANSECNWFSYGRNVKNQPMQDSETLMKIHLQSMALSQKQLENSTPVPVNSPCPIPSEVVSISPSSPDTKEKGRESSRFTRIFYSPPLQKISNIPLDCKAAYRNEKVYVWKGIAKKSNAIEADTKEQDMKRKKLPVAEVAPYGFPPRIEAPKRSPVLKKKRKAMQLPMKSVLIGASCIRKQCSTHKPSASKPTQPDVSMLQKVPFDALLRGMVVSLKCRALTTEQVRLLINMVTGLNYHVAEVTDEETQCSSFYIQPISKITTNEADAKPSSLSDASFVMGTKVHKICDDSVKTSSVSDGNNSAVWMVGSDGFPRKVSMTDSASMAFSFAPNASLVDLKSNSTVVHPTTEPSASRDEQQSEKEGDPVTPDAAMQVHR